LSFLNHAYRLRIGQTVACPGHEFGYAVPSISPTATFSPKRVAQGNEVEHDRGVVLIYLNQGIVLYSGPLANAMFFFAARSATKHSCR